MDVKQWRQREEGVGRGRQVVDYKLRVLLVSVRPHPLSHAACLVPLGLLRGAATTSAKPRLFRLGLNFGRTTALSGRTRDFTRGSVGGFLALNGIVNDGGISKLEVIWHLWRATTFTFLAWLLRGGSGSAAGSEAAGLHRFEGFFIL